MYQSFIIMLSPSNVVFLLFKRYSMPSPSDPPPTREEEKLAARLSFIACARCNQTLCWKHYVLDFHYC